MLSTYLPRILTYRHTRSLSDILKEVPELVGGVVLDSSLTHPDVEIISPLEEKTTISLEQIHTLLRRETFHPRLASQTTIIFYPAHAMTLPAQQALLKTLEETPAKTQFLLVTNRPYALIPTILSRAILQSVTGGTVQTEILPAFPTTRAAALAESERLAAKRETAIATLEAVSTTDPRLPVRRAAIRALQLLHKNVNSKLVLDTFFFETLK